MIVVFKRSFEIVLEAWQIFNCDYGLAIARHLALSGLFTFFPYLIFAPFIVAF